MAKTLSAYTPVDSGSRDMSVESPSESMSKNAKPGALNTLAETATTSHTQTDPLGHGVSLRRTGTEALACKLTTMEGPNQTEKTSSDGIRQMHYVAMAPDPIRRKLYIEA